MGRHGKASAAVLAAATIAVVAALAGATADDRRVSKPAGAPRTGLGLLVGGGPRLVSRVPVGHSTRGRRIVVTATGTPSAPRHVLVVGCIHGTECAGTAVARLVGDGPPGQCPPNGADLWARRVAWLPSGRAFAIVRGDAAGTRSEAVIVPQRGARRVLLVVPARLADVLASPDGRWLLLSAPDAGQWLLVRTSGPGHLTALSRVGRQFDPGGRGRPALPGLDGWIR